MERIGIDDVIADLRRRMASVNEYREAVAELDGAGEAAGGLVRATVGAGGTVKDLQLDPRAMRLDSFTLREALLEAIAQATADAQEKMSQAATDLDAQTARFMDAGAMQQEMDRMMAGFTKDVGAIQQNFETLMRKLGQVR